jgi:putative DNA methylase
MSVAAPKSQAKEPIQLDVVLVCRKAVQDTRRVRAAAVVLGESASRSLDKLRRLTSIGLNLSRSDRRLVFVGQFLAGLGPVACPEDAVHALLGQQAALEELANSSSAMLMQRARSETARSSAGLEQYPLWTEELSNAGDSRVAS